MPAESHVENSPWIGSFRTTGNDGKVEEFLMSVGHTKENAKRLGTPVTTFTFSNNDGKCGYRIEFEGFSKDTPFELGKPFQYPAKNRGEGVIITQRYDWTEPTRTMRSTVKTTEGFDFTEDYTFAPDYNSAELVRTSPSVQSRTVLQRIAECKPL
ncbi:uncharacterized protein LOC129585340 [Paramacrobiotus metropolitanus]|uniref:uncharacterized protein LOC129585340 n=1 Tax=Paramacrobiotus metropolitanus TaxID=2943436 RepID=UPI0024457882|nr:uncharacterized protein LOC129585340 [Paramacrobiotus metropolitanus]